MRDKKYMILAIGGGLSLLTLIVLASAHSRNASFLSLESRWLAVAGIPILVALLAGGYINRFKGFGIELESELQASVNEESLVKAPGILLHASDIAEQAQEIAKGSLDQLYQMDQEKREKIRLLRFVMQGYYVPGVIEEYYNALPKLQFLEIRDQSDVLRCILPKEAINASNIESFVDSLREATVPQEFRPVSVRIAIESKDNLLVAIEKLRNSGFESLPVLDRNEVVGILDRSTAFERLADTIVQARLKG